MLPLFMNYAKTDLLTAAKMQSKELQIKGFEGT
jgi:hypothetical protein